MTIMTEERFENQTGIINPRLLEQAVTVIGAGAIGGFFTVAGCKMGLQKVTVYDFDKIEEHNIATQFFPEMMVGTPKTEALVYVAGQYSGVTIVGKNMKWEGQDTDKILVVAVDNMTVRQAAWKYAKEKTRVEFFIDGRMGAQVYRAYAIDMKDPKQVAFYEKSLYDAKDAVQDRCTEKSVIYTVLLVAGTMLNLLKKVLKNEKRPVEVIYDAVHDVYSPTYIK